MSVEVKRTPTADRPTKHTLPDGTEVPIDEESYEIGYTEGQMADRFGEKKRVEVVRCKDCRYRKLEGEITRFYWCRINERSVDDDDFCTWGERKGGGNE